MREVAPGLVIVTVMVLMTWWLWDASLPPGPGCIVIAQAWVLGCR